MQLNPQLIKQFRTDRGWTQQQLADICALSLRTIQRVELQGLGSLETSKALATAFAVDREQLLSLSGSPAESGQTGTSPRQPLWMAAAFTLGLTAGTLLTWLLSR